VGTGLYGECIIAIENGAVVDVDIGTCDVETVGIERERAGGGISVDEGVRDGDVVPNELHIPADRLCGLEMLNRAYTQFQH